MAYCLSLHLMVVPDSRKQATQGLEHLKPWPNEGLHVQNGALCADKGGGCSHSFTLMNLAPHYHPRRRFLLLVPFLDEETEPQ
jgi:hypothetical protein